LPAAVHAPAVAAICDPANRRVNLRELPGRLAEQGGDVLALEGQRGALRIVLVVGARCGRFDDPGQFSVKSGYCLDGAGALGRQQVGWRFLAAHRR